MYYIIFENKEVKVSLLKYCHFKMRDIKAELLEKHKIDVDYKLDFMKDEMELTCNNKVVVQSISALDWHTVDTNFIMSLCVGANKLTS